MLCFAADWALPCTGAEGLVYEVSGWVLGRRESQDHRPTHPSDILLDDSVYEATAPVLRQQTYRGNVLFPVDYVPVGCKVIPASWLHRWSWLPLQSHIGDARNSPTRGNAKAVGRMPGITVEKHRHWWPQCRERSGAVFPWLSISSHHAPDGIQKRRE